MFALAGFAAVAAGCGDDNNVPDAPKVDAQMIDAALPPAQLALSPLTADFGTVTVGQTSSTMTFTVTNNGGSPSGTLSATVMGSGAANFAVETNTCTTLAATATCTVTVSFSPQSKGAKTASLQVSGTPGGSVSATLDGMGNDVGNLSISPSTNAFPDTVVGQTSTSSATFTVTNTGGTTTPALTVSSSGTNANEFSKGSDTCNGQTLAANATCTFTVAFKPQSAGAKSATFTASATGLNQTSASVTGNGISDAHLTVNPTLQDFGTVTTGSASSTVTFTVINTGGVASGAVTQALGGADAGQFSIVSSSCSGATVAANGGSCTVGVRFSPSTQGQKVATLTFTGTPGGTATATLLGTANPPGVISPNPSTLTFAATTVGQTSASQTVMITNNGGTPTGPLTTSLAGNNPGDFSIVSGSNGCAGTVLAASSSCSISIAFAPTSGGAKSANLSVVGVPGGTATVGLTGNGIPPAHFSITPASHDYGSVGIGSMTGFFSFTVTNDGGQTSGAPTVVLGGANATQFSMQNACSTALPVNGTCTVQVRFAPTVVGSDTATVTVTGTPGGTATATVFGQGVNPSDLVVQNGVTSIDFNGDDTMSSAPVLFDGNAILIGDTVTEQFNLTNNGTEPTGTIMLSVSGANAADFTVTSPCTTLVQNQSCTVTVTFKPTQVGAEAATVLATASPGGSQSVSLSGNGAQRFAVSPTSKDFGATVVNIVTASAPTQTFTFVNNASTTQTVGTATLSDTTDYHIFGNTCDAAMLAAQQTCTIQVRFQPTTTGSKPATLTETISGGGTATATLAGNGVNSLTIVGASNAALPYPITCSGTGCDFGMVPLDTPSDTLTVTVTAPTGSPTTNTISTSLSNTDFQIISDACAGMTLASGASCIIKVRFQPSGTAGARTAGLTVTASPAGGTATLNLTGTAVTGAALALNPASTLDFGTIVSGTTSEKTITVTNNGGAPSGPLTYTLTDSASGNYALDVQMGDCVSGTTILAKSGSSGSSCVVHVKFLPTTQSATTQGPINGTLRFSTNGAAGLSAPVDITLTGKSSPSITIAPAVKDFGDVAVGSTNNTSFTVTNASSNAITVTMAAIANITGPAGAATVTSNTCTGSIAAGATCMIGVQFAPTSAATYDDRLTVTSANGLAVADIKARALTAPSVAITPASTDLGSALAGSANGGTAVYTVTNSGQTAGNLTLSITPVTGAAGDFTQTATTCGASLAANSSCTVTLKFTPPAGAAQGPRQATLGAAIAGGNTATATAKATVQASGNILITPSTASFPDTINGQTSAAQTFTLVNSGAASQNLALTLSNGNAGDFMIATNNCPASLNAGQSCMVTVVFKPTSGAGFKQTQLSEDGGADLFPYAALSGNALGPAALAIKGTDSSGATNCTANCGTFAYGSVATQDVKSETFVVTNTGGVASAALAATTVDGNDPSQFKVTADTCSGTAVAPNASCNVVVTYTPTAVGNKSANVHIAGFTVALTGTGVLQAVLGITPSAAQMLASSPVDAVGASVDFTITNGGDVDTSSNLSFSLSNTKDFRFGTPAVAGVSPCTQTAPLLAGAKCAIRVTFDPQTFGSDVTTLTVTAGAGATGTTTVTNTVTASGTSTITVSPATFAFNDTTVSTASSNTATLTFTNNGDDQTAVLHTILAGANPDQFSILSDNCSGNPLAHLATCTITAKFTPQGVGSKSATITVTGAVGSPTATLSGTATP